MTAIDLSRVGIAELRKLAENHLLSIRVEVGDILTMPLVCEYNLVLASGVVHDLNKEQGSQVIELMKTNTVVGGVNFITTWGDGCLARDPILKGGYFHSKGELAKYYADAIRWKILLDQSEPAELGPGQFNILHTLITQRIA